jgi:hypothetical protein
MCLCPKYQRTLRISYVRNMIQRLVQILINNRSMRSKVGCTERIVVSGWRRIRTATQHDFGRWPDMGVDVGIGYIWSSGMGIHACVSLED